MKATTYLALEHENIQVMLGIFGKMLGRLKKEDTSVFDHLDSVFDFFKIYADSIHHGKEEKILFDKVITRLPYTGGALCSYYKTLQLVRPEISSTVLELYKTTNKNPPPDLFSSLKGAGSNVNPLLEEHILGRTFITTLEHAKNTNNPALLYSIGQNYRDLLSEHIEKENKCLFALLDESLSASEQDELVKAFQAFDATHQDLINSSLKKLKDLEKIYL